MIVSSLEQAVNCLHLGGVIGYATEGVFGLGCDPDNIDAIKRILEIKQRSEHKGLILIAASLEQLFPYADFGRLSPKQHDVVLESWPGHVTWVIPAHAHTSQWLRGQFSSIAVRVTAHSQVRELCQAFGKPMVSTSANLSGEPASLCAKELEAHLGSYLDLILEGDVLSAHGASQIYDAVTGLQLR